MVDTTPVACCFVWLQMRHPLALAHYANHPAADTQPNVMVAAFDMALKSGKPIFSHSRLLSASHYRYGCMATVSQLHIQCLLYVWTCNYATLCKAVACLTCFCALMRLHKQCVCAIPALTMYSANMPMHAYLVHQQAVLPPGQSVLVPVQHNQLWQC